MTCSHRGPPTGEALRCSNCASRVELKLFACARHGQCTLAKSVPGTPCCAQCSDYHAATTSPQENQGDGATRNAMSMPRWCVGVTTVPERRSTYLPLTLRSLEAGGFPSPRLFIDGANDADYHTLPQEKVWRGTPLRTFGNWTLGLWELLVRNPTCDRFAMFQDDAICVTNLRQYLDKLQYPDNSNEAKACGYRAPGYWNLFSLPGNERLARGRKGWYESNQRGWGAVGLVFNRQAVIEVLQSNHTVTRPVGAMHQHDKIDGGIVTAMMKAGYLEYVHAPSLIQHIGAVSSMNNAQHAMPTTFPGEKYNALELITKM